MQTNINDILERADPEVLSDKNTLEICDLMVLLAQIIRDQQNTIEQQRIYIKTLEG